MSGICIGPKKDTCPAAPDAGRVPARNFSMETGTQHDLLAALAGKRADQASAVAHRTRRVIGVSIGVMHQHQAGQKQNRSLALAATLIILLMVSPLVWWATENFLVGGHGSLTAGHFSLLIFFRGAALLASALLAGWLHKRS